MLYKVEFKNNKFFFFNKNVFYIRDNSFVVIQVCLIYSNFDFKNKIK